MKLDLNGGRFKFNCFDNHPVGLSVAACESVSVAFGLYVVGESALRAGLLFWAIAVAYRNRIPCADERGQDRVGSFWSSPYIEPS